MSRDRGWQGDDLKGWGEREEKIILPECSAADSERIMELARQIPKGTYKESTLIRLFSEGKGFRPKGFFLRDVPAEIRRIGNRWGITYDAVHDEYLVWGGGTRPKGYKPKYQGDVKLEWVTMATDVVRRMQNKRYKWSTFAVYFTAAARKAGYSKDRSNVADCILQGRIQVPVLLEEEHITVLGGIG